MNFRALLYCTFLLIFPCSASAQINMESPSLNDMSQGGKAFDKTPIAQPTISPVNIRVNWQLWKAVVNKGEAGVDELTALGHDSHSLGISNESEYATVVLAEAMKAKPDLARKLFQRSQALAPNLPYPFLAYASYFALKEPMNFPDWGEKAIIGIGNMFSWPDTYYAWALKLLTFFLISLVFSSVIFTIAQLIRHLPIVIYEATRIMPSGFSNNQSAIVLLAIIIVPGVTLRSPLISALIMLAFVSLVQNWSERIISSLLFASISLIPTFDLMVFKYASYYGSRTQKLARAQYERCDKACQKELKILLLVAPKDKMIAYTSLLAKYRDGAPDALKEIVQVDDSLWPEDYRGHLQNLKGAAFVALARPTEAIEVLNKSMQTVKSSAPRFNLMRAYQMQNNLDAASNALAQAVDLDIDRVTEYLRYDRRDVNSFLIVEPIPLAVFHAYKAKEKNEDGRSPVAMVWNTLSGPSVQLNQATLIGIFGLFFVLLGAFLQFKGRTSTPCPRCGLARDPDDTDKTSDHKFCLLCYRTFVMGSTLDYQARVYNEKVLGRRETLQSLGRRFLSLLTPGGGHHLAGRSLSGFLLSFSLIFSGLILLKPLGIIRPPFEYFSENWLWQSTFAWMVISLCLFSTLLSAWRDIPPVISRGAK